MAERDRKDNASEQTPPAAFGFRDSARPEAILFMPYPLGAARLQPF